MIDYNKPEWDRRVDHEQRKCHQAMLDRQAAAQDLKESMLSLLAAILLVIYVIIN